MGHVSDRYPQTVAGARLLAIDRIIKVTRILAVDSDKGLCTQIDAKRFILLSRLITQTTGFFQHLIGPLIGNMMGLNRNIDFQAWI